MLLLCISKSGWHRGCDTTTLCCNIKVAFAPKIRIILRFFYHYFRVALGKLPCLIASTLKMTGTLMLLRKEETHLYTYILSIVQSDDLKRLKRSFPLKRQSLPEFSHCMKVSIFQLLVSIWFIFECLLFLFLNTSKYSQMRRTVESRLLLADQRAPGKIGRYQLGHCAMI